MAVPIDANRSRAALVERSPDPSHEIVSPVRCCRAAGVAQTHALRSSFGGRSEQGTKVIRRRAYRILGDVRDLETFAFGKRDRLVGAAEKPCEIPFFRILPDRTGTDEQQGFNGDTGQLCDFGNRLDIHHERPGRTVRANAQAALGNFAAQGNYGCTLTGAGSGQANVRGLDSEAFHEVKDADLGFHGRVGD